MIISHAEIFFYRIVFLCWNINGMITTLGHTLYYHIGSRISSLYIVFIIQSKFQFQIFNQHQNIFVIQCYLCFEIGLRYLSHCNIVGFLLLYYTLLLTPFTQHSWELGYLTTSNSSIFPLSTLIL